MATISSPRSSGAGWEPISKYVAPWLLTSLGSSLGHPAGGNLGAFFLLIGVCLLAPHRIKAVEIVLAFFFLLAGISQATSYLPWIEPRLSYLAPALLAAMAFGSLAVGRPFTVAFAKEIVPPDKWQEPPFFVINRILTALWGVAFLACVALKIISALPAYASGALCLAVMFLTGCFTRWFPDWYERKFILPDDDGP